MNIAVSGRPSQSPSSITQIQAGGLEHCSAKLCALQNSAITCVAGRSCSASIFASATSLSNGRGVPVCSVPPYPRSLSAIRPHSPLSLFTLSRALQVCPLYCCIVARCLPEGQCFLGESGTSFRSSSLQICHFATPFLYGFIHDFLRRQKQLWGRPVASGCPHNPV